MPPLFCWDVRIAADGLPPPSEAQWGLVDEFVRHSPPTGGGGDSPHVTSEFGEAPHPSALRAATLPTARGCATLEGGKERSA